MELSNCLCLGLLAGVLATPVWAPTAAAGQPPDRFQTRPDPMILVGSGATIGISIREVEPAEAERLKLAGGVSIEEVQPDSPAEKAGLKKSDIVTEFDGEPVRGARQLARLVSETPPGRAVTVAVVRDGRRVEASITPDRGRVADGLIDRDRLADRLEDLQNRIPLPPDFERSDSEGRLGATVQSLTPQLADYFGVKTGVLVSAVAENTPASRAGLKAGDVIRTVNQKDITSRAGLLRALREIGGSGDLSIGIVRDKKESSLTVTLDAPGLRRGRPARFTRAA